MALKEMRKELVELVNEIKKAGGEFTKKPPLFTWSYDEHPDIEFTMLIATKKTIEESKAEPTSSIILTN